MIRILIVLILAAIAIPVAYFNFKSTPIVKKMLLVGGAVGAAAAGVILQFLNFAFYIPLLAIVGISLIVSFVYIKILEKEQEAKRQEIEERKARKEKMITAQTEEAKQPIPEPVLTKSFAMQSIGTGGEGQ